MVAGNDAYAIPIGKAVTIAKQIESGKATATVHVGATAFLGVQVQSAVSGGYGGYPGYGGSPGYGSSSTTAGALVAGVVTGGPAASAGLVPGDVITAINGQKVSAPTAISSIVLKLKPGAKVNVTYVDQSGTSQSTTVTLGSGPPQ
jgi:S1-C subfamily serine protease